MTKAERLRGVTGWELGFNDGMAFAAIDCFGNCREGAGVHLMQQVRLDWLDLEHYAELGAAAALAGYGREFREKCDEERRNHPGALPDCEAPDDFETRRPAVCLSK